MEQAPPSSGAESVRERPPLVLLERDEGPIGLQPPPGTTSRTVERGDRALALLLAAAAVLAAVLGARASFLAGESSAAWQQAVRQEVKRAAAAVEDIRFVYGDEAPAAYRVIEARVRSESFRRAADAASGEVRALLLAEAFAQEQVAAALEPSSELASDDRYSLPGGSVDVGRRLADQRAEDPELVAIDPDEPQAEGDRLARHAALTVSAGLPLGFTFLLGALARAFPSRRRPFLVLGLVALGGSLVAALAVELLAG